MHFASGFYDKVSAGYTENSLLHDCYIGQPYTTSAFTHKLVKRRRHDVFDISATGQVAEALGILAVLEPKFRCYVRMIHLYQASQFLMNL